MSDLLSSAGLLWLLCVVGLSGVPSCTVMQDFSLLSAWLQNPEPSLPWNQNFSFITRGLAQVVSLLPALQFQPVF